MTQLESAKYFPEGFMEGLEPTKAAVVSDTATRTETLDPNAPPVMQQPAALPSEKYSGAQWTWQLTAVAWMCGIIGFWGFVGSLGQLWGFMEFEQSLSILDKYGSAEQVAAGQAAFESFKTFAVFHYGLVFLRMFAAAFLLFSVASIRGMKVGANTLMAMACMVGIFYNLCDFFVTWLTTPSAEAMDVPPEIYQTIVFFALGFLGVVIVVKIVIFSAVYFFMSNDNNTLLFSGNKCSLLN
ncbi:MAG: hypothetical protein AB8B55_16520 [Mariniblastus sp.]